MTSGKFATRPSGVRYDERDWPIVVITLPPKTLNEAEFRENLQDMGRYADRGGEFGFVVDTRGAPDPNAVRRRAIAEFWDDCMRRHADTFIGAAIVMTSPTGRAVFKAILWLRTSALQLFPVATPQEGLEKLRGATDTLKKRRTAT